MAVGKLPEADIEGSEESIFSEINVTPLTDIFLVLLIIFMVGSTIEAQKAKDEVVQEKSSGLKVNLPSGAAAEVDPGRMSLVISIAKDGQIEVNGQRVSDEGLEKALMSAFTTDKDTQVVLRADAGVHHGRVVGIMERAKRVGLHRLAIATRSGS
jgi:biopolymer transport protein ExbD